MAMREVQVCGHRLTGGGSGISIRPATGSAGTACASAKGRLRLRRPSATSVARRQTAEQMAQLLRSVVRRAERENGHTEIARPGKHPLQPLLRERLEVLPHVGP